MPSSTSQPPLRRFWPSFVDTAKEEDYLRATRPFEARVGGALVMVGSLVFASGIVVDQGASWSFLSQLALTRLTLVILAVLTLLAAREPQPSRSFDRLLLLYLASTVGILTWERVLRYPHDFLPDGGLAFYLMCALGLAVVPLRFEARVACALLLAVAGGAGLAMTVGDPVVVLIGEQMIFGVAACALGTAAYQERQGRRLWAQTDALTRSHQQVEALLEANEQARAELKILAERDPLTGAHNRRAAHEAWRRIANDGGGSVVVLDIDHFKTVNDRYGHAAGDAVLQAIVDAMRACARSTDVVARWGGDELLVLASDPDAGRIIAERVVELVRRTSILARGQRIPVTVSVGVASGDGALEHMVHRADEALYEVKALGRDGWASAG